MTSRGAHGEHAQQQKQEHEQKQKEGLNMYSKMVNNGYYRVRATYDKPLKYCPYGSAGVVIGNDGTIHLVSYTTRVISLTRDGWMDCIGTYSATTRKHIGAFMKEYGNGLTYYTAKELAETGNQMNIYTGEIKEA